MLNFWKEYFVINKSGLFDPAFYLRNYLDVRKADVDPLTHFIRYGWREGRNPSSSFDINFYLNSYPDVRDKRINPLVHYIRHGKHEGREISGVLFPSETNCQFRNEYNFIVEPVHFEGIDTFSNSRVLYKKNIKNFLKRVVFYARKVINILREEGWQSLFNKVKNKFTHNTRRIGNPRKEEIGNDKQGIYPDPKKIFFEDELFQIFCKLLVNDKYIISISHDNYNKHVGGVQIQISDEQKKSNSEGIDYIHLYPYYYIDTYLQINDSPFFVGLSCNGKDIGATNSDELIKSLKRLAPRKVSGIHIHHTMGFSVSLLHRLLNELGENKGRFWCHDYFSVCPSYCLLRNNLDYCGAPDINSNSCMICKYRDNRLLYRLEFQKLFNKYEFDVISPSEFSLSLWQNKFVPAGLHGRVLPLASLHWKNNIQKLEQNGPLNIAFVGYPVHHKGWNIWIDFTSSMRTDYRFKFFHFSKVAGKKGNYKQKSVSVTSGNRMAMVSALRKNSIDVAFLWSLWPETFSFTLYESIASGCFIITNKNSGNIQNFLKKNPSRGIILESLVELIELFSSGKIIAMVNEYHKNGIPQADIVFTNTKDNN